MKKLLLLVCVLSTMGFASTRSSELTESETTVVVTPFVGVNGSLLGVNSKLGVYPNITFGGEVRFYNSEVLTVSKMTDKKDVKLGLGAGLRENITFLPLDNGLSTQFNTMIYGVAEAEIGIKEDLSGYIAAKPQIGFAALNGTIVFEGGHKAGISVGGDLEGGLKYKNFRFGAVVGNETKRIGKTFYPQLNVGLNFGYDFEVARF